MNLTSRLSKALKGVKSLIPNEKFGKKYTERVEEKGQIFRWMRELGLDISKKQTILSPVKSDNMAKPKL